MQVAIARVAPAAGRKAVASADLQRCLDRFLQAFDRDDDVLGDLAAALRGDGEGGRCHATATGGGGEQLA
jgi:hypothetical protein